MEADKIANVRRSAASKPLKRIEKPMFFKICQPGDWWEISKDPSKFYSHSNFGQFSTYRKFQVAFLGWLFFVKSVPTLLWGKRACMKQPKWSVIPLVMHQFYLLKSGEVPKFGSSRVSQPIDQPHRTIRNASLSQTLEMFLCASSVNPIHTEGFPRSFPHKNDPDK